MQTNETPLTALEGQPLCKHYTGATANNLSGDYSCRCLAGVAYELFPSSMERWPCRARHLLGAEQAKCDKANYGDTGIGARIKAQVDEMVSNALKC